MESLPDILLPKRKYFGLSIERSAIRGIELDKKGKIIAQTEVLLPEDLFQQGVLTKPEIFVQSVKTLLQNGKFTTPYVTVCFPEAFAYTRGLTLPILPPGELEEAVSWHAKDLFPFPRDEIYFDWKILLRKERELQFAVVAVQKNVLDPLVSGLIASGLKPLRFEPDASAISRLIKIPQDKHILLTDINKRGAYVTLVEGEKSLFTTVIHYTTTDTSATYVANIKQTLTEIAQYYTSKGILKAGDIEVILTGEVASSDWSRFLPYPSKLLQIPGLSPSFVKSYVAATAHVVPPSDQTSINLLPENMQSYYDTERNLRFFQTILFRTSFAVATMACVAGVSFFSITIQRQMLDSEVKTLTSETANQTGNTQKLLLLNSLAKQVVTLGPLRVTPKKKLDVLSGLIPKDITVTQWEYDDSKLLFTLTGSASTRDALLSFKQALEQSEEFTKITLPLGSLETPINVQFSMTFMSK